MRAKLIDDYQQYSDIQDSDLLLTQLGADDTHRKVTADNVVPLASVMGAAFDYETTGTGGIWWKELGRETLTGSANEVSVDSFAETLFLKVQIYTYTNGSNTTQNLEFNGDSNANYSQRYSDNGGADNTGLTSQTQIVLIGSSTRVPQYELFIINNALTEKLCVGRRIDSGTAGAGNTGNRQEIVCKWSNTNQAITSIRFFNTQVGTFDTGTTIVVLGHN